MKKALALILAFIMMFALSACGGSSTPAAIPAPTPEETPAPSPAPTEEPAPVAVEAPVEEAAAEVEAAADVYSMPISLDGTEGTVILELIDDVNARFSAFMNFDCTYEKIGSAVVLTPVEELTETKGQIWAAVKHAYLLNDADMSLTALEGAYKAGELVFYLLDESSMRAEHPVYSFGKEGFTYTIEDGVLKVTAPDAKSLGAFAKVWDAMGAAEWTIDGNSVAPVSG